ncbi:hypothetical protein [Bacteroides faecis]|uniref:hypothetical protein n=1 Tax=Bacteroides faecis TaxID=674529 RepID=UPI00101F6F3A|nr:hypothetical protein [Bacteroides faecis]KAA5264864.1 hypothetical protein F2Z41_20610 [Bacteroides faecis]MCE9011543.1 hypothetical protein [Bacteroides faecis]RYT82746.1 hypothetical protein EAJ04_20580 [Bacteroides faecis]
MNIINLLPNIFMAIIAIMLLRVCAFVLDTPIVNYWFDLDRERRKIAEELKLSLTSDKDRESINKKIALYNLASILYIVLTGSILYLFLIT